MAKRGGKRQGVPGRAYAQRTDMMHNYRPQDVTATAAAGPFSDVPRPSGVANVNPSPQTQQPAPVSWSGADDVPNLTDPSGLPDQDPTAGLGSTPMLPEASYLSKLYAAYNLMPTPELRDALNYLSAMGV